MDGGTVTTILSQVGSWALAAGAGVYGFWQNRQKRAVQDAANTAQIADYRADATLSGAAQSQITQLLDRVDKLEQKYSGLWDELQAEKQASSKLRDRVRQLEGILRVNNITVPPEN